MLLRAMLEGGMAHLVLAVREASIRLPELQRRPAVKAEDLARDLGRVGCEADASRVADGAPEAAEEDLEASVLVAGAGAAPAEAQVAIVRCTRKPVSILRAATCSYRLLARSGCNHLLIMALLARCELFSLVGHVQTTSGALPPSGNGHCASEHRLRFLLADHNM